MGLYETQQREQILEEYKQRKQVVKIVESYIVENNFEQAEKLLNEHFDHYKQDLDWVLAYSIVLFNKGDIISAIETLENIYYMYEYNLDLNYNLALCYYNINNFDIFAKHCGRIMYMDSSEWYSKQLLELLMNLPEWTDDVKNLIQRQAEIMEREYVRFPEYGMQPAGDSDKHAGYIGKAFEINGKEYACGVYGSNYTKDMHINLFQKYYDRFLITTEIYETQKGTSFFLKADEKCVIPIMNSVFENPIEFTINGSQVVNRSLVDGSHYYFGFQKNDRISVQSENPFFMGKPLYLKHHQNNKKLVLALFIDGLPQCEFNKENMPETFKKFKSGIIFNNAFCNGEWTLPSVANIFTGKDTMHHRIYHPSFSTDNLKKFELYTKILSEQGYLCSMIGGDWRVTPDFGYMKNLDRCIYKSTPYDEANEPKFMNDLIEHLEAFGEADNFVWLSLMHLHGIADEHELPLSCQVRMPFEIRTEEATKEKSVHKGYSEVKKERLKYVMRHLDNLLHQLYLYLDYRYGDDYVISVISDHGQSYLVPDGDDFLDIQRSNIAMMISGNENQGVCDELVQAVDFFPALLARINIRDNMDDVQGRIPQILGGDSERQYTITESLFPDAPYYICICDKVYKYFFHTKNRTTKEGTIDVSQYQYKLVDRNTNQDITLEKQELVDYYTDITFQHIRNYITGIE